MNAKILLPPLVIVICIALMIWLIYPAYTNGVDGLREKRQVLTTEKKKLADTREKAGNVSRLTNYLEQNKIDQTTVLAFVPDSLLEEEIIDNLNFIAGNEGLLVTNLSVKAASLTPEEKGVTVKGTPKFEEGVADLLMSGPQTREYNVSFSMVGNYDKIKNALEKVYRLGRYNVLESLEIKKLADPNDKKKESSDALVASAMYKFNVVKKVQEVDISNPVFSLASFDMSVAQTIRNKKNIQVLKLNIDAVGRNNPFFP